MISHRNKIEASKKIFEMVQNKELVWTPLTEGKRIIPYGFSTKMGAVTIICLKGHVYEGVAVPGLLMVGFITVSVGKVPNRIFDIVSKHYYDGLSSEKPSSLDRKDLRHAGLLNAPASDTEGATRRVRPA
jgi:hypothetical protein